MHFPILRAGKPYKSLSVLDVKDFRTGEKIAELSQANSGLIRKDFAQADANKRALDELSVQELLTMCKQAAELFMNEALPIDGTTQSPEEYVQILSVTTGMPQALCRNNMQKIHRVLTDMVEVLGGLTRGLDLQILDQGWGQQNGRPLSYLCQTNALGTVLPNNSPGVHSIRRTIPAPRKFSCVVGSPCSSAMYPQSGIGRKIRVFKSTAPVGARF